MLILSSDAFGNQVLRTENLWILKNIYIALFKCIPYWIAEDKYLSSVI